MQQEERKLVVVDEAEPAPTVKPVSKGIEAIRKAADMILEDYAVEIAMAMKVSSENGHVQSAKFLIDLAEGNEAVAEACLNRLPSSVAEELQAEKPWTGENCESSEDQQATANRNSDAELNTARRSRS